MRQIFKIGILVLGGLLFLISTSQLRAAKVFLEGSTIVFENNYIRYEVDQNGVSRSLVEKTSGKEYIVKSEKQSFMYVRTSGKKGGLFKVIDYLQQQGYLSSIKTGGGEIGSSKVSLENDILKVEFGNSGVTGSVKVEARDDCFIFELIDVKGTNVEVFGMARLHLNITEHIGSTLNVAFNGKFGIGLLGLNLKTHAEGESENKAIMGVSCIPRFGMVGAKFVMIGVPAKEMLPLIGKLEIEFGLPHPLLDGEWDKVSKAVETSYLFINGNQANIDSCIRYAKAGGFKYLMLLGGCFSSYGHYPINTKMFPDGLAGLKATMKKIHGAGLKGGTHFLVGWISKNDSYVTPVPDKRMTKDGKLTLSKEVDDKSDFIGTVESPEGYPTETNPIGKGGHEIQIGDELIIYSGLSTSQPFGFTGCRRGAYGTKVSSYQKGAPVYHMLETWGHYMVGADTDMLDEMASAMGKILNECEVDMIYFDGGETMADLGPGWYYIGKVKEAYYRNIKREILYQGSGTETYAWHIYSRGNSDDCVALAPKKFLDRHKAGNRVRWYANNLMPAEFGWWGYFTHSPSVDATLPDEIEYGYSKGAGFDTPMGFETEMWELAGNGRTNEVLAMTKRWEELRLSGKVSDKMKEELRTLGQEHTLIKDASGQWIIHRITYGPDHIIKSSSPSGNAWSYHNVYPSQPVRMRIRAKSHQSEYGDQKNISLTDFTAVNDFKSRTASSDISIALSVSAEQVKVGKESWKITGSNKGTQKSSWAELEYRYKTPLNLVNNRAPGVWVFGDGSGALLNISIVERQGVMRRDHYIDLNFTGWKYCELSEPEAERVYEYDWPYSVKWPTRHVNYEAISRIDFFLNEIPAGKTVTCYLSPVEALTDQPAAMTNPTLTIGSNSIMFPATLHDDEYLEYWGEGKAKVYNPNNFAVKEVLPNGKLTVVNGSNNVTFSCKSENNKFRAKVTIIALGEALK